MSSRQFEALESEVVSLRAELDAAKKRIAELETQLVKYKLESSTHNIHRPMARIIAIDEKMPSQDNSPHLIPDY